MIPGSKVILRTFKDSDLLPVLELRNAASSQMSYNGQPLGTSSRFVAQFQKTGFWGPAEGGGQMLICGHDEALLGEIRFSETSAHIQTVSYMLFRQTDYGKGYATESLHLMTNYLFSTFSTLNRLQLYVHVENAGSIRVAEKCSYVREGIARETLFIGGRFCDQYCYSLLRREWIPSKVG